MGTRWSLAWIALFVAGCSFDASTLGARACESDAECAVGASCVEGFCQSDAVPTDTEPQRDNGVDGSDAPPGADTPASDTAPPPSDATREDGEETTGGCRDNDRDGFGDGPGCSGPDCDDTDPRVHPGRVESCNGVDDDCDGLTDANSAGDPLTRRCSTDCGDGVEICSRGVFGACSAGEATPEIGFGTPVCSDGEDNDCDGAIDRDDSGCRQCSSDDDCQDGTLCNGVERCLDSVCAPGTPIRCPPSENPCAEATCEPATGECVESPRDGRDCTIDSACVLAARCSGGACVAVERRVCDDGFACTTDSCDDERGCVTTPDDEACGDAIACTVDRCVGAGSGDPSGCVNVPTDDRCDDEIPCTTDTCLPERGGCVNTPNHPRCEDGLFCTENMCTPESATADAEGCTMRLNHTTCDDGSECNVNRCDPLFDCTSTPLDSNCDDSIGCTRDRCVRGSCQNDAINARCSSSDPCLAPSCEPRSTDDPTGCIFAPIPDCGGSDAGDGDGH